MLHPNQAKSGGQLNFAVAHLHLDFSPLRKARAANMPQAGNAVNNTGDPQHKIVRIQRRQTQRVARRGHPLCGWNRLEQRAVAGDQFPGDVHFAGRELLQ